MSTKKHWNDALSLWDGTLEYSYDHLSLAALMSIRKELQQLNAVFACRNVQRGFSALTRIAKLNEDAFQRRVNDATRKRIGRRKRK